MRTRDIRRLPEGDRWKKKMVLDMETSFAEFLDPDLAKPETVVIGGDRLDVGGTPVPDIRQQSRRLRITPEDLRRYGYTAGCPGCIHVQPGAGPPATTTKYAELALTRSGVSQRPAELEKSRRQIDVRPSSHANWRWKMQEFNVIKQQRTPTPRSKEMSPSSSLLSSSCLIPMSLLVRPQPKSSKNTHQRRPKAERRHGQVMRKWGSPSYSWIEIGLRTTFGILWRQGQQLRADIDPMQGLTAPRARSRRIGQI